MTKRHKHADLMHTYAENCGVEIECKSLTTGNWHVITNPAWIEDMEYRIKPEKKPDVVINYLFEKYDGKSFPKYHTAARDYEFNVDGRPCNLRLTFSGETGELIKAEVIK